ncbi:MAG: TetR/AcrR family transcriptional regulator [Acidimicrobiales bacterium]
MQRARVTTKRDNQRSATTRAAIITATAEVICDRGFLGATTAAIAERANVNQGVIFYHFGTLVELFSETLHTSSTARLEAYRQGLDGVTGIGALLARAAELFREDQASGHVTVLAQLVAGAGSIAELHATVVTHVEQWVGFVEEIMVAHLPDGGLAALLPAPAQMAVLVVSLYLGAELLLDLAPGLGVQAALEDVQQRLGALAGLAGGLLKP